MTHTGKSQGHNTFLIAAVYGAPIRSSQDGTLQVGHLEPEGDLLEKEDEGLEPEESGVQMYASTRLVCLTATMYSGIPVSVAVALGNIPV